MPARPASKFSRPIARLAEPGVWELARTTPPPELRAYVREYVGWWEEAPAPIVRREPPTDIVPVIISFGSRVRIFEGGNESRWAEHRSFTTGLYDRFVLVGTDARSSGLQVNLSFLGARLFLGQPLGDLVNLTVSLSDLFGSAAGRLSDELQSAAGWPERFAVLDRELVARIRAARAPAPLVARATSRLVETAGQVSVSALVAAAGCSQKHFIAQFRRELGLTPKRLARVLRFGRAVSRLKRGGADLATIALDCGYYDQPHFDRDFKAFAGLSPSALLETALPSGGFDAAPGSGR